MNEASHSLYTMEFLIQALICQLLNVYALLNVLYSNKNLCSGSLVNVLSW